MSAGAGFRQSLMNTNRHSGIEKRRGGTPPLRSLPHYVSRGCRAEVGRSQTKSDEDGSPTTLHASRSTLHVSHPPHPPMHTIIATLHGIMTGQTNPSWPDQFDAWMFER